MEPLQATLKLNGAAPASVTVLDVYGVPTPTTVPIDKDGSFALGGESQTYYSEVRH